MFQPRLRVRLFFEFGIAKYVKIWYTGGDESRDQADGQEPKQCGAVGGELQLRRGGKGLEAFAIGAGFKKVENGISLSGAFLIRGSIRFSILD